jgi:uncharacterized membrane protein
MSIIYALVEPTECKGIQIVTIKLLLVISIVFVFFGTPWYKTRLNYTGCIKKKETFRNQAYC